MNDEETYVSPFKLNEPLTGGAVGKVQKSTSSDFQQGDLVYSFEYPWQSYALFEGDKIKELKKLDKIFLKHPSYALSVLGMPGMTAYWGLTDICKPKKGETLVVTGAGGAVGSMVGQIGKIYGCHVVGIAGSDEKLSEMKKLGFDEGINYKKEGDKLKEAIERFCPDGVDCFFDNVGGPIMDAVMENLNNGARVAICGAISQYHGDNLTGKRYNWFMAQKSILMKGFIVFNDYKDKYDEGMDQMAKWLNAGKLKINETCEQGIENAPKALLNLFEGKNVGKQIINLDASSSH